MIRTLGKRFIKEIESKDCGKPKERFLRFFNEVMTSNIKNVIRFSNIKIENDDEDFNVCITYYGKAIITYDIFYRWRFKTQKFELYIIKDVEIDC